MAADALLEHLVPGVAEELSLRSQLLHHLEACARWAEAHRCVCAIIELCVNTGSSMELDSLFERACQSWEHSDPVAGIASPWLALARAASSELQGNYYVVDVQAQLALTAAHGLNDACCTLRALLCLARNDWFAGEMGRAETRLQEVLDLARATGQPDQEAQALYQLANLNMTLSRFNESYELFLQAQALFASQDNQQALAVLQMDLGSVLSAQGRSEDAYKASLHGLELARRVGNRRLEGWLLGNISNQLSKLGRVDSALEHSQQALRILDEVGDRATHAHFAGNLGVLYEELGNKELARQLFEQALEEHRSNGSARPAAAMLGNLSDWHLRHGDPVRAREYAEQSAEAYQSMGDLLSQGWALGLLANAHTALGDAEDAEMTYCQATKLLRANTEPPELAEALTDWVSARLQHPGMQPEAAVDTLQLLEEAETLALRTDLVHDTELLEQIAALREQLQEQGSSIS